MSLEFTNLKISYDESTNKVIFRNERCVSNNRKSYDYAYLNKENIQETINYLINLLHETTTTEIKKENTNKMILNEETRDLFSVPQGYYLAHCISNDFALGAGIAVLFDKSYNMKKKLNDNFDKDENHVGEALLIDNVFNLVTKSKCYQKPTMESLEKSLVDMKIQMKYLDIEKLAIPQIGCGLDKLDWNEVKSKIEEVFCDMEVEILICYL